MPKRADGFLRGAFFFGWMAVVQAGFCQTPEENQAAYLASGVMTKLSYHYDAMSGGNPSVPVVASTSRTDLPYAPSLSTLVWDPVNQPGLYQQKSIGGVLYDCTLVATFASGATNYWNQPSGTEQHLWYGSESDKNYIFPYVTVGNDLKSYLSQTYFTTDVAPASDQVTLRIQQSLGLPAAPATDRGVAFFWVPMDNIIRSGYSPNPAAVPSGLAQNPDGTYIPMNTMPADYTYVDFSNNKKTYTGPDANTEFTSYNQGETTFPWTAMGYTFNWNYLQDGSNPAWGNDPLAPDNFFGLSEFMVSGGTNIVLDSWIPYSDLGTWVVSVPEPGTYILLLFGAGVLVLRRRFSTAR